MLVPTNPIAYPALVIDGSGSCFFAGILGSDGKWLASEKADAPALESLFKTVDTVLKNAAVKLNTIESYIYCEGPGSVLGLRLCAIAIETWIRIYPGEKQIYAYNSLELVAANLLNQGKVNGETLLISDWKKDTWNGLRLTSDQPGTVTPIRSTELSEWSGPLYHLPARKGWQAPPERAIEVSYNPDCLTELLVNFDIIQPRESVTLYSSGINSFQKWTPERHRAPVL